MIRLEYPYTADKVGQLKVGDIVNLSGHVVTGRDRFHRHLAEGGASPVALRDGAIYHCGPVVVREGNEWAIRAAGPTTSVRMERYTEFLLKKFAVRVIIGKGGMGEAARKACMRYGCVYLHAIGGTASLLASQIASVDGVHFLREFGSAEAVWELSVRGLEAVVTIDTKGRSLHKRVASSSKQALADLLK